MSSRSILSAPKIAIHVRWMVRRDLISVLAIERFCYGDDSWSGQLLMHWLKHRQCIASVAETTEGEIVGFAVYRLRHESRQILNLAVHPKYRLAGVGRSLVQHIKGSIASPECRRRRLTCYLPDANVGGQCFLRECGFRCTGIVREFFEGGEDAYRFELEREGRPARELQKI